MHPRSVRGTRRRPRVAVWLIAAAAVAATAVALSLVALKTGRFHLYHAAVSRVGTNLYQDDANPGFFIQTRRCVEPAQGVSALLRFEGVGSRSNRLVFYDRETWRSCDVVRVLWNTGGVPRALAVATVLADADMREERR